MKTRLHLLLVAVSAVVPAIAADVLPPAEVADVLVGKSGDDVSLTWPAVSTDILGNSETVDGYRVYRGTLPSFVPDKAGGSNVVSTPSGTTFADEGAISQPDNFFYLVSAVDSAGNEGNTRPSKVQTPPGLSVWFSTTAANLDWTAAGPSEAVTGYQVMWSGTSLSYSREQGTEGTLTANIFPLRSSITYYFGVFAYDGEHNLSALSNEVSGQLVPGGSGTNVSGRISGDTTWTLANSPYIVTGSVQVYDNATTPAVLTIEPGVVVRFKSGTYLRIASGSSYLGALIALGTPTQPIIFTSDSSSPDSGDWNGVRFDNATVDGLSILDYCAVEYAGPSGGSIYINTASPTIRNSVIRMSGRWGIEVINRLSAPVIEHNYFEQIAEYDLRSGGGGTVTGNTFSHGAYLGSVFTDPTIQDNTFDNYAPPYMLRLPAHSVGKLTGNTFNDTTVDSVIEVIPTDIITSGAWTNPGVPYEMTEDADLEVYGDSVTPVTLTLEPGVTIRFAPGMYLKIAPSGLAALVAAGTEAEPITFTVDSASPAPGSWGGIYLYDRVVDATTILDHCVVEYAGQSEASIHVNHSSPTIRNSTIRHSGGKGIRIWQYAPYSSPLIADNLFVGNGDYDLYEIGPGPGYVTATGNTFSHAAYFSSDGTNPTVQDNTFNDYAAPYLLRVPGHTLGSLSGNVFNDTDASSEIEAVIEEITTDTTWMNLGVPYHLIGSTLNVYGDAEGPATLTLEAGVTLRFDPEAYFKIAPSHTAALVAVGTESQPITFTVDSASPAPGAWRGLYLYDGTVSETTILDHCVVEYAGQSLAGIFVDQVSPTIRNSTIRYSGGHGLRVKKSDSVLEGNVIHDSALNGIQVESSSPTIRLSEILDNGGFGVEISSTGSQPVIQHNDFTGNELGALSKASGDIVDARFNWYGDAFGPSGLGPGTGQSITHSVAFSPWLVGPFSAANFFDEMFSSTPTFQPGSFSRFTGSVTQDSSWTLRIFDTIEEVVRTIGGSGSDIQVDWIGDDDQGGLLPDGRYRYQFEATSNATLDPAAATGLTGHVHLNATNAVAEVVDPGHMQTFGAESVAIFGTADGPNFTGYTLQYGAGLFPSAYDDILVSSAPVDDALLGLWDTSGLASGTYALRLLVDNDQAEQTVVDLGAIVFSLDHLSVNRPAFSPNGDGRLDDVTAAATLSEVADWTLDIVDDSTSNLIRSYAGSDENVSVVWDGTLSNGVTVAAEGVYRFEFVATVEGQPLVDEAATTRLDVTPPTASITDPAHDDQVFDTVNVVGDAFDPGGVLRDYLLESGIGAVPSSYTRIVLSSSPVSGGLLGNWATNDSELHSESDNGRHTIRLVVTDLAGNVTQVLRSVILDNLEFLGVLVPTREIDTYLSETAEIRFSIDRPADVTLTIRPEQEGLSGPVLKTLSASFPAGESSFVWDGTADATGLAVPDEAYVFILDAVDGTGRTDRYAPVGGQEQWGAYGYPDEEHNPYTNDFWEMDVNMAGRPQRLTLRAVTDGQDFFILDGKPFDGGEHHLEWDGRDPSGQIIDVDVFVGWPVPIQLRPNYLITNGDSPKVTGIAADPHRVVMSYAQVSLLGFSLEHDAIVTVTLLPPDVADPDDPSGVRLLSNAPIAAGAYELMLDPVDPTDPNENSFLFGATGAYTFAIEAENPDSGTTTLARGVLNMHP